MTQGIGSRGITIKNLKDHKIYLSPPLPIAAVFLCDCADE